MNTFVVHMANEKRFGCKGVGLNINIRPRNFVHKGTFPDVWITRKDKSPSIDLNGGETSEMLSDLLQICQRIFLSLDNSSHSNYQNVKLHGDYRPSAARLSCLHRYNESPNFIKRK